MNLYIGVIGVGGLGYLQAKTYDELDSVTIVAAADVTADARELFESEFHAPAYDNYRALLHEHGDELDAVMIVTPHTLHYEQTMACLKHGLHVLVEKPMVTDVAHAKDIVAEAAERGLVVQVGYQRRFHDGFREIERLLRSGRIGNVHSANCHVSQNWIGSHEGTWRVNADLSGGGQLYDTGSHLLDTLVWLTDAEPTAVTAQMDYSEPRIDVNSSLTVLLERETRNVTAAVSITGDGTETIPNEGYYFWGTEGKLAYADDELVIAERDGATYRTRIATDADFDSLNRRKLENFLDSIEDRGEPAVTGTDGLLVTALTEAAYRAHETGSRVSVQSLIENETVEQA